MPGGEMAFSGSEVSLARAIGFRDMNVEVLCIGQAAYHLSVFTPGFPEEEGRVETDALREEGGGAAANAAHLIASWGATCAFAGVVGTDAHGEQIREELLAVGAEVGHLEMRSGYPTPFTVVLVNRQNGSRTMITRKETRGAGLHWSPETLAGFAVPPKVIFLDGHEPEASLAALAAFPDAISILDAGSWKDGTARLAGEVDYLLGSEKFARQATGISMFNGDANRRRCLRQLREWFATTVVITLGADGLIADDGHGCWHLPAFPARRVDTTGVRDVFSGAFTHAMSRGKAWADGLRFASMAASLSIRQAGGRSSIPHRTEVEAALAKV